MFTSVQGRSVIVTGASKGIGKGIAKVFADAGANVLIVSRNAAAGAAAAAELGPLVSAIAGDVANLEDCTAFAAAAVERHGGIDILCANAGIFPEANLDAMTVADLDLVLGTNVKGSILSVQACLPGLRASGRGRVILTSSITGPVTGFAGWSHYGASKAAQLGFMRGAAVELASQKITVNAVLPGNIETEGLAAMGPEYRESMQASIPMGVLGTPADIGNACLFFATEEAAYITGQALIIDGGQVLPESFDAVSR